MSKSIQQRIDFNKRVRETVDSILSLVGEQSPEFWEEFACELKRRDLLQAEDSSSDSPLEDMNTLQAQKFEVVPMPFGKYKDTLIKDLPLDYLCNLLDPNDFTKKLRKYVAYRQRTSG